MNSNIIKMVINEAEKSNMYPFKLGSIIFNGKRILGKGHNRKGFCGKIHPKYRNEFDSLHAEQNAILSVKDWSKLKNASIIVLRLNRKNNNLSMSKPCKKCMSMIKHVGIKEIYYSNNKGEIKKICL